MKLPRRQVLRMGWGLGAAAAAAAWVRPIQGATKQADAWPKLHWQETALLAFGTTVWMRVAHEDQAQASIGLAAATKAVQRVDQLMSLFRPDSEVVRLNRDGELRNPAPELVKVLKLSQKVARASAGLFDPTVQPLWQLWDQASQQNRRPAPAAWQTAKGLVDWQAVHVAADLIRFAKPGMAITLNGIAQGFAADEAAAALRRAHIEHALLQTGEWMPMGRPAEQASWRLGLSNPHVPDDIIATLEADGRAVACSSDDKMSFSADRRDHHILDPRSGYSPTQLSSVVVVAPSCALADALTKPMFMGSARDALALAKQWQVDVVTISKQGHVSASSGLKGLKLGPPISQEQR